MSLVCPMHMYAIVGGGACYIVGGGACYIVGGGACYIVGGGGACYIVGGGACLGYDTQRDRLNRGPRKSV
eukprot:4018852-Pyramimonas_sp.AAC.1